MPKTMKAIVAAASDLRGRLLSAVDEDGGVQYADGGLPSTWKTIPNADAVTTTRFTPPTLLNVAGWPWRPGLAEQVAQRGNKNAIRCGGCLADGIGGSGRGGVERARQHGGFEGRWSCRAI
jgi:hypothetical protein